MLGHMESQHPYYHYSFSLGTRILGSVNILSHSFADLIYALSYLVGNYWLNSYCTRCGPAEQYSGCRTYLFGDYNVPNKYFRLLNCKCRCYVLDCAQDPQGV